MAIGPTQQDEAVSPAPLQFIRAMTSKTIRAYFENPTHYLFYCMLTATIIGLFFGRSFSFIYYGFLAALGFLELWRTMPRSTKLPDPALDK